MRIRLRPLLVLVRGALEHFALAILLPVRFTPGRYHHGWVLMDRDYQADDNAEHLFRHLREHHTDIDAWFVIRRDSPDWARLVADGFADRVVSLGSWQWFVLLLRCDHVVSSHTEEPMWGPRGVSLIRVKQLRRPGWKFTFLRHGVTQANLSHLLNHKNIELLVTNTEAEHESFVGEDSGYRFTAAQVKMTGMPRFDRLLEVGRSISPGERDLVLVAPSWRASLVVRRVPGSQRRELGEEFLASDYAQSWLQFLRSPELGDICARLGVDIGFLPHPNLDSTLPLMNFPPHVKPLNYADHDVQSLFARAAAFVTDYSSISFDLAYIDRPVVYFQFDQAEVLRGAAHTFRQGYFDYERDGLGPVTTTVEDAVRAVVELGNAGFQVPSDYATRTQEMFPQRDGKCCQRVIAAINAM